MKKRAVRKTALFQAKGEREPLQVGIGRGMERTAMRREACQTEARKGSGGPELLAPAGDMACLRAAIAAGADAVYLGGQRYSARAFAGNFSDGELREAIRLAHFFGRKLYLTVNTLMKDGELEGLEDWLFPFYEEGLDGLIVQDLGVLARCGQAFPELSLHASTQMTVTESRAALFLKSLGVTRIVPARELSLEEIGRLKKESGLEIETFIHGALCYSYSGQCLFSSILGGRSGNRGRCAQPCRLPYEIRCREKTERSGKKRGLSGPVPRYPLSLKDLCTLPFLPELIGAGIDSFKIEGRMKGPEYVAGVTGTYRKYIDRFLELSEEGACVSGERRDGEGDCAAGKWKIEPADLELLSGLYVRSETCGGYYHRHNGREMVTPNAPGYNGCAPALLEQVRERWLKKGLTRSVDLSAALSPGSLIRLTAECGGERVCLEGPEVMTAQNHPMQEADVIRQLSKMGGSPFSAGRVNVRLCGECFLPLSALNSLRRKTLDALYEKMVGRSERKGTAGKIKTGAKNGIRTAEGEHSEAERMEKRGPGQAEGIGMCLQRGKTFRPEKKGAGTFKAPLSLSVSVLDPIQGLEAIQEPCVKRIYLPADAARDASAGVFLTAVRKRKSTDGEFTLFLSLPVILRAYSALWEAELQKWLDTPDGALADGFLVSGLSGLCLAKQWGRKISLSHPLYVFNAETLSLLMRHFEIDSYTAPLELNRYELRALPALCQERLVYGRIPMMISANCVRRTAGACRTGQDMDSLARGILRQEFAGSLIDRRGTAFPVYADCVHCLNTVYNSVPLSLHRYRDEIIAERPGALQLDFTDEDAVTVGKAIDCFVRGTPSPAAEYTTGHYQKGVQ